MNRGTTRSTALILLVSVLEIVGCESTAFAPPRCSGASLFASAAFTQPRLQAWKDPDTSVDALCKIPKSR